MVAPFYHYHCAVCGLAERSVRESESIAAATREQDRKTNRVHISLPPNGGNRNTKTVVQVPTVDNARMAKIVTSQKEAKHGEIVHHIQEIPKI